jgi:hypothetical protein
MAMVRRVFSWIVKAKNKFLEKEDKIFYGLMVIVCLALLVFQLTRRPPATDTSEEFSKQRAAEERQKALVVRLKR